jgi:hypothetical protein
MPSPNVSGAETNSLLGVSCRSATACVAVGDSGATDGDESSLSELLRSGTWTIQATPDVAGASITILTGVSCPVVTMCTAAGYSVGGSGDTTLVEQSNGTNWTVVTSASLAGDEDTGLNGVACESTTFCAAAGSGPDGTGLDDSLVEQN